MFNLWPRGSGIARQFDALVSSQKQILSDLQSIKVSLAGLQSTIMQGFTTMSGNFANLNAQITLEQSEVQEIVATVTQLEQQVAALTAAAGTGDQAQIDAATAALQSSIDSLKASIASAAPPASGGGDTTGGGSSTPPVSGGGDDTTGGGASTPASTRR